REQEHQLNQFVRRDRIFWLPEDHPPAQHYLHWAEQLRLRLNRELFLGLFDYECLYAHYQQGGFYKKHLDAFAGSSNRRLTTILYLNPEWSPQDGGELLLYASDGETLLETVIPTFGTMVIFLSDEFPHEVRVANRSRYSLTGWFRINNLNLDPPA
ncbi:MAG: 2OG-Fe(II) oxygenase, partial [Gammaproteobacteria bacterium]|nr:2OG-Fe(II) oxygenase [Gammaproteobacteria bacterium]